MPSPFYPASVVLFQLHGEGRGGRGGEGGGGGVGGHGKSYASPHLCIILNTYH